MATVRTSHQDTKPLREQRSGNHPFPCSIVSPELVDSTGPLAASWAFVVFPLGRHCDVVPGGSRIVKTEE
jgi:hypothetical protein